MSGLNNYNAEILEIWSMVKKSLMEKRTEDTVNLWFKEVEILSFDDNEITMVTTSEFKFRIIKEKYLKDVEEEFCKILGFPITINFRFQGKPDQASLSEKDSGKKYDRDDITGLPVFNFEYTFDNFIVGSTNKFAQAACYAVANDPANKYNPLFIYGNSGLGKTHLLCAMINHMKKNNPNINIVYTKGEDFTNQMILSLTNKTMEEFRDKFRNCDVLLIDDIQFIAGKTATQEEFFHTFNRLFENRKQIILTSDRPPVDIHPLEDRLVSRFEWGLIADIEPPDLELRIAIIKKKAEQVNVLMPDEVLTFLAENLRSNIRQIEGAIKKLGAKYFLSGREITMEEAKGCLSELLGGAEPISVTVDKIFTVIYEKYGVSKEDLVSPKRNKNIAQVRHICIYMIRQVAELSFPNIAKIFGRDHSTIISSIEAVSSKMMADVNFCMEIDHLEDELKEM